MFEELFCTFDVSMLLKKHEFNEPCFCFYNDGLFSPSVMANHSLVVTNTELDTKEIYNKDKVCAAPTLQLACKWLREKHGIDTIVFHEKLPLGTYWGRVEKHPYTVYQTEPIYKTYEMAELENIKFALENLKSGLEYLNF